MRPKSFLVDYFAIGEREFEFKIQNDKGFDYGKV
jgi:hypothetical protein